MVSPANVYGESGATLTVDLIPQRHKYLAYFEYATRATSSCGHIRFTRSDSFDELATKIS